MPRASIRNCDSHTRNAMSLRNKSYISSGSLTPLSFLFAGEGVLCPQRSIILATVYNYLERYSWAHWLSTSRSQSSLMVRPMLS